jgi:transposase
MKIKAIGFDLAKNLFQVHGVDEQERPVLRRQLRRSQVLEFFARLEPCLVGMEACAAAHYWARKLTELGHTVRLMAPQFVKPYVKANKNDARDAEAICEALLRPSMRFVPVKSAEQQAVLSLHRLREGLIESRTAMVNRLRALLAEFGLVVPAGRKRFEDALPRLLHEGQEVPELLRGAIGAIREELLACNRQIALIEGRLRAWHRSNEASRRAEKIPGVGMLTATAAVATLGGNARVFDRGRQFAAWVGLTPREHSSGGKVRRFGISKRGDSYLRKLLVHGARAVVRAHRPERDPWVTALLARRPKNVAVVAVAQRNARILWAVLASGMPYQPKTV